MVTTTQAQTDVNRVAPIVLGRKDYLSVLLRLIGMEHTQVILDRKSTRLNSSHT